MTYSQPATDDTPLAGSGPPVGAYVAMMVIGAGLLVAIGATAASMRRAPATPEVVIDVPTYTMDERLSAVFTDAPSEAMDQPGTSAFDAGMLFCDRAIKSLEANLGTPGTPERLIIRCTIEELRSYRPALVAWMDATAELYAGGGENAARALSTDDLTRRLGQVYDLRDLGHALHAATNQLEYACSERLIAAGIESTRAIEESHRFAVSSQIAAQLHLRELQRTELARIEAVLEYCRKHWDNWRHLKSDSAVVFYEKRFTTEYERLRQELSLVRAEIRAAERAMFGAEQPVDQDSS